MILGEWLEALPDQRHRHNWVKLDTDTNRDHWMVKFPRGEARMVLFLVQNGPDIVDYCDYRVIPEEELSFWYDAQRTYGEN